MATSSVANLVVSLEANIAKFSTDMQKAASTTQQTMNGIREGAMMARNALGALGIAFSAASVFNWAKETVAAASALDDLADSTGSSVENLSKLANQAKISGVEFATMETLVNRMAAGMGGADEATTKVKVALKALGVESKDPAQAVFEVAKKMDLYADGVNKAALAREIFGKQGPKFLAMLKDMASGHEALATVTAKQAEDAEKLEQAIRRLSAESTIFANVILSRVVPAIYEEIKAFNLARAAGFGFFASLNQMGGEEGASGRLAKFTGQLAEAQARLNAEEAKGTAASETKAALLRREVEGLTAKVQMYQTLVRLYRESEAPKSFMNADRAVIAAFKPEAPAMPDTSKAKKGVDEYVHSLKEWNDQMKLMDEARKDWLKAEQDKLDLVYKSIEAEQKIIDGIKETTAGYDKQAFALTHTTEEILKKEQARIIEIANNLRVMEGADRLVTAYDEQAAAIGRLIDANKSAEFKKSLADQEAQFKRTYDSISDTITDALMRGFESGKDWAKNFVQTLKNMFATLVLRPIIQGVVAPVAGGLASGFSGTANAAGGIGNLVSLGSSAAGGISSLFGASGFTAGLAGDAFMPAAMMGGLGGAGIGASLAPLLAAAPYLAIAAIAIPMIIKAFDKGPASRTGTFASGYLGSDSSRDAVFSSSSAFGKFGIAKDFWLGPEAGTAFKPTLDAITQLDNTIASMVGTGMTKTIADALAKHSITVGLGKEGTDINASGGPAAILKDRYVTVVTAINAGLGQLVANFEGTGQELATFVELLVAFDSGLSDVGTTLQKVGEVATKTTTDVWREQGNALDELAANFDGSTSATTALVQASNEYYNSTVALLAQIRDVGAAIDAMFVSTREQIYLTGRTNEFQYNYWRELADAQVESIKAMTDPAAIAAAETSINDMLLKSFGLLDPESQVALRDEFLQGIDQANKIGTDRLAELGTTVISAATSDLRQVKDLLAEIAGKMGTAADKQTVAADTQLAAARTPVQVSVTVTDAAGQEAYSGGGG